MLVSTLLLLLITSAIFYTKWSFGYWSRLKVPCIQPKTPFGNIIVGKGDPLYVSFAKFYEKVKRQGHKHAGFYVCFKPVYVPIDLDYVKRVMIKDFSSFTDHGLEFNENEPLTKNLVTLNGTKWKEMRQALAPCFSAAKLKLLTELVVECAEPLREFFEKTEGPVHVNEAFINYSVDVIGSCTFGIECNSFKNPEAEFKQHAVNLFKMTWGRILRVILVFCLPKLFFLLGFKVVRENSSDFYLKSIKSVLDYRERNGCRRNDALQTFIDLKRTQKVPITAEDIAGQAYLFFVAGHETTSTAISFAVFEIAKNKRIQKKVRDEIVSVLERHEGKITYEALSELKYVEQVIDETLRMYPPSPIHFRIVTRDYNIPDTDVTLRAGTAVVIPAMSIQNDPEYFENPHVFDPERFSEENKGKIQPVTFQPFGAGPRLCLAYKFAIIEMKIAIIAAIKDFEVNLSPNTPPIPKWDRFSLMLHNKYDMFVDFKKIRR